MAHDHDEHRRDAAEAHAHEPAHGHPAQGPDDGHPPGCGDHGHNREHGHGPRDEGPSHLQRAPNDHGHAHSAPGHAPDLEPAHDGRGHAPGQAHSEPRHTHDHAHDGHTHDHGYGHAHIHASGRSLAWALGLAATLLVVLCMGAWLSNSLALWADAGHLVTDVAALALSLFATRQTLRPPDARRTFGYHRAGVLAALANASALLLVTGWIGYEAYHRLQAPPAVAPAPMLVTAGIGLVVNLAITRLLHGHTEGNLNVKSAFWHVVGDAAASAGVLVGAIAILGTGWSLIDPLLSFGLALLIAHSAWKLAGESLHVLLEGTPARLDLRAVEADLLALPGVAAVHDMHAWTLGTGRESFSAHLVLTVEDAHIALAIVEEASHMLTHRYRLSHTTLQPERTGCHEGPCLFA